MMFSFLLALLPLPQEAAGGSTPAQVEVERRDQALRVRLRGTVRDTAGAPWPDARVVLVASLGGYTDLGSEALEVRSDARGRFRASVVPGRGYSIWAHGEPRDGGFRCTEVVERAHAGTIVKLRESPLEHRRLQVRITKRERWADREPLRFRVTASTENAFSVDLDVGRDGLATLPPLPGRDCVLEAFGSDGTVVLVRSLVLTPKAGDAEQTPVLDVEMSERFYWSLKVVSGDKKPVAGVAIQQRISYLDQRSRWMHAGTTDENGIALIRVTTLQDAPAAALRQHLYMRVRGPNAAVLQIGRSVTLDRGRKPEAVRASPDHTVTVTRACSLKGRVLIGEGKPAANRKMLLFPTLGNARSRSVYFNMKPVIVETDGAGRFETSGWGSRFGYRLCLGTDAEVLAALQRADAPPIAPAQIIASGIGSGDTDLGDIRIDELPVVDVSVRRADGFPARGAELALAEHAPSFEFTPGATRGAASQKAGKKPGATPRKERLQVYCYKPLRMSVGPRGKLRVLVPPSGFLNVAVFWEGAWAFEPFEPEKTPLIDVKLREPVFVTGRVRSASGKPVPGALVQANPVRYPAGFNTRLSTLFQNRQVRADAEGRFKLGLPFEDTSYYFWSRIQIEGRWYNTRQPFLIHVDDETNGGEPLEFELPVPEKALPKK